MADKPKRRGRPRNNLPVVPLKLPRCPGCRSTDCPIERTLNRAEGYSRQLRNCSQCGKKFETIWD
jgi:hypothetical protein